MRVSSFCFILGLILILVALLPALKKRSWPWFFFALCLSFAVVILPLFIFLFSSFLMPEWKGACSHGWLDCFIGCKIVLLPIVLWATTALYALEILRVKNRASRWIVLGISLGALTAVGCFTIGVICFRSDAALRWWLCVPLYFSAWYSVRAVQLIRERSLGFWAYFISFISSMPLWLASWIWSKYAFESLPNQEPDGCFIVTAASRGHEKCVGPLVKISRHGRQLYANHQLLTFWEFENWWQNNSSGSHRLFRHFYNRVGPIVARQIKSPWQADLVHLVIKPVELVARFTLQADIKNITNQK